MVSRPLRVGPWRRLAPLLLGLLIVAPPPALSVAPPASGERLTYSIGWLGVPVANSTLAVLDQTTVDNRPAYHFTGDTKSNDVIRLIYPVDSRVDSYVDAERFLPIRYTMSGRAGSRTRERVLEFDHARHSVVMTQDGKSRVYPTAAGAQDPLSALQYYRRTAKLTPGEVVKIPVHDRKRPKDLVITAGQAEPIKTPAGTFQAVRLKIEQQRDGVRVKEDGDITLWMTPDERRLPVRLLAKVAVGTVTADLTIVKPGGPTVIKPAP